MCMIVKLKLSNPIDLQDIKSSFVLNIYFFSPKTTIAVNFFGLNY